MVNKPFLIFGGLAAIWYGAVNAWRSLIVGVSNYAFRGFDLTTGSVQLYLNIMVKNPLLFGVTVKSVQGDVYIQGQRVGYINTTLDYYVTGGGKTHILPVIVNLSIAGVANGLLANINSGDVRSLQVAFDGKIYVTNKNIPIPVQKELTWADMTA